MLSEYQELNYISIITFTTKADLKVKTKTDVVYTVNLLKTIRKYDKETVSDSVKEKVYKKLLSLNIDDKEERTEHVRSIYKNINEKNRKITENICPRCGGTLVRKNGKYGSFTGCSNYPKCKFTVK